MTKEKEQELVQNMLAFKGEIPGIVDISAGINEEQERARGYTVGLRVTFDSREAYQAYVPHPVHHEFVQSLQGILEHAVFVDYPVSR